MAETTISPQALREGYEPDDIRVGGVVLAGAAALVVLALTLLVLWGLVALLTERSRPPEATAIEQTPLATPAPRLQADPGADLAALRAAEGASLHRWAWVDRQGGIVRIPIEQAMAELARRGWPQVDRPAPTIPPRAGDAQGPPSNAGATGRGNDSRQPAGWAASP